MFAKYTSPHNEDEKMIYIQCEECGGVGQQMFPRLYPNGHTEVWEVCKTCGGDGNIEIAESDYIIMKLEGSA